MVFDAVSTSRILSMPLQRDHDLAIVRRLAADEAGVAALRHQRDPVLVGELADRGDFGGRARAQHQRRMAVEEVALLGGVGRDIGGIGHRIFVADDLAEFCDEVAGEGSRGRSRLHDVHCLQVQVFSPSQSRPTAARRRRSLMASPSPWFGMGITAIVRAALASSARR